jgi:hypothetical protein
MFVISVFNVVLSLESFAFVLRAFLRDVSKHLPLLLLKILPFKFTLPVNVRISLIFEGGLQELYSRCLSANSFELSIDRKSYTTELLRSKGLRVTSLMKKE